METKIEIGSWRDNEMNIKDFKWTREPDDYTLTDDKIEIITQHSTSFSKQLYHSLVCESDCTGLKASA